MHYIIEHWDADGDGILDGEQPNTSDIAFFGSNMYIGVLWLVALRAEADTSLLLEGVAEEAIKAV